MYNFIPQNLQGDIWIPASKSVIHRALIIAFLSGRRIVLKNVTYSKDIMATIKALESLGGHFVLEDKQIIVEKSNVKKVANINVNESGTTLRFIIPLALLQSESITITGENNLVNRPLDAYLPLFEKLGINYEYNGQLPLTIQGQLMPGDYEITGDKSSQFLSALLLALPFLGGDSTISVKGKLESASYVKLTIGILNEFGIEIKQEGSTYFIRGNQNSTIDEYLVEGDYSQASFFLVMNALGANLKLYNLNRASKQGDLRILEFLKEAGILFDEYFLVKEKKLQPFVVDLRDNPDLAPVLSVLALKCEGVSMLTGLGRLKYKESNRITSTVKMLEAVGAKVEYGDNFIKIYPSELHYGIVDDYNDHRIVMSSVCLSLLTPLSIKNIEPINKSYPGFMEDYQSVGGQLLSELEVARFLIDVADQAIREAFTKRMQAVDLVKAYKLEHNLPIYDGTREKKVIERNLAAFTNNQYKEYYAEVLQTLIKVSKDYQENEK